MSTLRFDFADLGNGIQMHYAHCGQGRPMLFLHGFPEFWYAWKDALAEFGRDHHAVAPDLRGFNLSSKPAEVKAYRARHLVDDIERFTRHLGWERFTLVAHDWGGAVAWNFAAQHPDRLDHLIILNAPHPVTFARDLRDSPAQQAASRYMNLFREARAEALLAEDGHRRLFSMTLEAWARNGGRADAQDRTAYGEAWSQPGALTGALNYYRATPLHPPLPDEPAAPAMDAAQFYVKVPTLVIWGERDEALLPGILDGLDAHVRQLRIERVPEASHWIAHERPAQVHALMRNFLGRP